MIETADGHILSLMREQATREKGFTLLMDTFKERIYWHIRRLVVSHEDAEDILQETFINAYRYAGSFNGQSRIYTWLYRIATNECIKLFRKNKRTGGKTEKMTGKLVLELTFNDPESSENILVRFQQAIQQLPERQRIVFNLHYYDDLNYEEISQVLDTSVNALKTNYHYASEKIKEYLINH
jgi:RNA polymerase sigma-70 factor (ECF subfamily)